MIEVAEPGVPDMWTKVGSDCSARCVQTGRSTLEAFNVALGARRERGW